MCYTVLHGYTINAIVQPLVLRKVGPCKGYPIIPAQPILPWEPTHRE